MNPRLITSILSHEYKREGISHAIDRQRYRDISRLRWAKFIKPESAMTVLPNGRYKEEVLGDGNIYDHQVAQSRLIKRYGRHDIEQPNLVTASLVPTSLTISDLIQLRVTALVHDEGEKGKGDVNYGEKLTMASTVEEELAIFRDEVNRIVKDKTLIPYIEEAYRIDFDKDHKLFRLFKLYEKYSYLNGALCAYNNRGNIERCSMLLHNVIYYQLDYLMGCVEKKIPSTCQFLRDFAPAILNFFAFIESDGFKDSNGEVEYKFQEVKRQFIEVYS